MPEAFVLNAQGFLQRLSGFELCRAGSRNLDWLAGLRIATRACLAVGDRKRAEARDVDFFTLLERFGCVNSALAESRSIMSDFVIRTPFP